MPHVALLENMAPVLCELSPDFVYPQLLRGLIGAWSPCLSRDKGARLLDIAGRNNHLALANMEPQTDWVATQYGTALRLDGSAEYALNSSVTKSTEGTLSGWVNFAAFPTASNAAVLLGILEPSPNTNANQCYVGCYNNAGSPRLAFVIRTGATTRWSHYGSTVLSTGNLYHLVLSKTEGSGPVAYVNGVAQTLTSNSGDLATTQWIDDLTSPQVQVGARITGGAANAFLNGDIYEALIHNRPLSAMRVEQLYSLGPGGWARQKNKRRSVDVAAGADGVGSADGDSTADAIGAANSAATGSADGDATATAIGQSTADSVGAADGHATAEAKGASTADVVGSADGDATADAVGIATADSVGAADGHATADAVGSSISGGAGVGAADGDATAAAIGASTADSSASADGHATAEAVGISTAASAAAAAGDSTAAAVGTVAGAGPDVPGIEYRATLDRLHYRAMLHRLHYRLGEHEADGGPDITVGLPYADFSASPLTGTEPLTVAFTDASTGTPTSWLWSFGDGETSTSQNPSHQYDDDGTYDVSLTVTNANGTTKTTRTAYVSVAASPYLAFDSFDRADSDSLGSTEVGSFAWTENTGDWDIASNKLEIDTTSAAVNENTCTIDSGVSDCVITGTLRIGTGQQLIGLSFRESNTSNRWLVELYTALNRVSFVKIEGGARAYVGTGSGDGFFLPVTPLAADTDYSFMLTLIGNSMTIVVAGGTATWTSSFNASATKHGAYAYHTLSNGSTLDDYGITV